MRKTASIILISFLYSITAVVFADELYDCNLVVNDTTSALNSINLTLKTPLSESDSENAMTDLKAYCCQEDILKNGCDAVSESESNPESPYIFDQLVSRWFFKLDNKVDGSKDTKASERADDLSKREQTWTGNLPVSIQNTFIEVRQPAQWDQANINTHTCEITNYDTLPLSARYTAVCEQSTCITQKFFQAVSDLTQRYDEMACKSMAKKRINDEMSYIQTLMVEKTNALMENVWQTYTQSYMLEDRRWTLLEKFYNMNQSFSSVNGKVQEWTQTCSSG